MRRVVTAMMLVFPVLAGTESDGEKLETLTVCEVIQNLESLNGKTVAIRGLAYGGEHENLLFPTQECPKERRRYGVVWNTTIHLVFPDTLDQGLKATRKQAQAAFGGEPHWKFRLVVTYIGRLSTKWNEIYEMPDGSYVGGGFGFMETSPAELRVVTGKDIEVSRISEEDEPKEKK